MEYERRAAVVASFHIGKKPVEVMACFGFKGTMVMDIWRKVCENKDEFTAKRKAHNVRSLAVRTDKFAVAAVKETVENDRSQSYAKIAADMSCHKMICQTINKNIGYSSYCKSYRMLITNVSKELRKVKAAALLNELKHGSAGMLRFSDEKNFIQDQTSNRQNDRWICKDIEEVPVMKHMKFPSSVMVFGVISSKGTVMSSSFKRAGESPLRSTRRL